MSKQQRKSMSSLALLGIPVLIVIALIWSVSLLGGGLWWFIQLSGIQSTQTKQLQPKSFAQVQNVPAGLFRYGGSAAWDRVRLMIDSAIQSERPEFQLRYVELNNSPPSSSKVIEMLLDGRLTLVQLARPLHNREYGQAEQRGFKLKQIPVAIDGIAIAVNRNLNISGLTVDQMRSIYSGQINNWKQIGGPDLNITPYSPPVGDNGTAEFFVEDILRGQVFGSNVKLIPTTTQALRRLANTPGGIYYASAPEIVPQCSTKALPLGRRTNEFVSPYQEPFVSPDECPNQRNQVNTKVFQTGRYPITRYLYVVTKENGRIEEQAGVAYANFLMTPQGQELIAKAGFMRIR